jgi:hypothetical protein
MRKLPSRKYPMHLRTLLMPSEPSGTDAKPKAAGALASSAQAYRPHNELVNMPAIAAMAMPS